jgi:hypothetical protein
MKPTHIRSLRTAGFCLLLALAPIAVKAEDSSTIRLRLQNTGLDADASGSVQSTLNPRRSTFTVQVEHLTPATSYAFLVGSIPEATINTDSRGQARLLFASPARRNVRLLDFDPRGKEVSLLQGSNVVLKAVVSGFGEPEGISISENAGIVSIEDNGGRATSRYQVSQSGKRTFVVSLANISGEDWNVYVDGVPRGAIDRRGRSGRLAFDDNPSPNEELLDFDPRGRVVDIAQGTNLVFSGPVRARGQGASSDVLVTRGALIPSTGVDADGIARARFRVDKDARRRFSVELEDVPAGGYELLANGIFQGTINVATSANGTEGELEFSNSSDDASELPLTFDPMTAAFIVRQGDVVFFQGPLTNMPSSLTNGPALLREALTSTGADADASGDAKFEVDDRGRRKFSVEIEDVAVGSYELWVGSVRRGTIVAQLKDAQVKGKLEFSSSNDDAGELPLRFEPLGQLIEVRAGSTIYFSHIFGVGATNGTTAIPMRIELPLFVTTALNGATARMGFKRDDRNRRSFEVELEDAAAGNYTLTVGGLVRGTISAAIVENGTRGQIQFEDEPDAGDFPLTFDPLEQLVTIEREGVTYFQRVLPSTD